ncbi:hypothetical protein M404DRAFT_1001427 [Pisolithus tinctorius Marx 270]|uniref:Uncharacterized protein n=1 Tax=Pisolithus tinctorius Marx 270 TaxID=870435 RepID=A0A0C3P7A5_PISTI|nr:hypothetical protein M404DRAFT_1001427 [Pisolithus tinctorius Marx 270]
MSIKPSQHRPMYIHPTQPASSALSPNFTQQIASPASQTPKPLHEKQNDSPCRRFLEELVSEG